MESCVAHVVLEMVLQIATELDGTQEEPVETIFVVVEDELFSPNVHHLN